MIVCLGWGSLIWRPEQLPLVNNRAEAWKKNGPELPVEFLRVSSNGCLTLVVDSDAPKSRVLWNELAVATLEEAVDHLRRREGDTRRSWIGRWPSSSDFECSEIVDKWARQQGLAGVVWTAIPPRFQEQNSIRPTLAEALDYLGQLEGKRLAEAEEYVRRAPLQIDTPYRRAFTQNLGWSPRSEI